MGMKISREGVGIRIPRATQRREAQGLSGRHAKGVRIPHPNLGRSRSFTSRCIDLASRCVRTTVTIRDSLLRRAREVSVRRGCTLSEVVEDALMIALDSRIKDRRSRSPVPSLKTFQGTGVQPGIDLTSSSGLLDLMEER